MSEEMTQENNIPKVYDPQSFEKKWYKIAGACVLIASLVVCRLLPWGGYSLRKWFTGRRSYEFLSDFFGSAAGVAVHQGKKTLSDPMMRLGAELRAHRIVYNNNPLDKWCLANTTYEEDKNGNIQPHKTNRPTRKIDGTAALLDAWVVMVDRMQDYMNLI